MEVTGHLPGTYFKMLTGKKLNKEVEVSKQWEQE